MLRIDPRCSPAHLNVSRMFILTTKHKFAVLFAHLQAQSGNLLTSTIQGLDIGGHVLVRMPCAKPVFSYQKVKESFPYHEN